jgi:hypothetical protein
VRAMGNRTSWMIVVTAWRERGEIRVRLSASDTQDPPHRYERLFASVDTASDAVRGWLAHIEDNGT